MELLSAVAWRLGESVQAEATPQKFRRLMPLNMERGEIDEA
jgi:hypothetical protein